MRHPNGSLHLSESAGAGAVTLSGGGPLTTVGVSDTPVRQRIFTCTPASPSEARPCAEEILSRLGEQAFRRPLSQNDLAGLMLFYDDGAEDGDFELGVRMALGADRGRVLRVVLKDGLLLTLAGVVIGGLAAVGLTRLFESQLYGVTPTDPVAFVLIGPALMTIALTAAFMPVRRALAVDPSEALRHD